jgi:hypothetical protein
MNLTLVGIFVLIPTSVWWIWSCASRDSAKTQKEASPVSARRAGFSTWRLRIVSTPGKLTAIMSTGASTAWLPETET